MEEQNKKLNQYLWDIFVDIKNGIGAQQAQTAIISAFRSAGWLDPAEAAKLKEELLDSNEHIEQLRVMLRGIHESKERVRNKLQSKLDNAEARVKELEKQLSNRRGLD